MCQEKDSDGFRRPSHDQMTIPESLGLWRFPIVFIIWILECRPCSAGPSCYESRLLSSRLLSLDAPFRPRKVLYKWYASSGIVVSSPSWKRVPASRNPFITNASVKILSWTCFKNSSWRLLCDERKETPDPKKRKDSGKKYKNPTDTLSQLLHPTIASGNTIPESYRFNTTLW